MKELEKDPMAEELEDEALETVSGGLGAMSGDGPAGSVSKRIIAGLPGQTTGEPDFTSNMM